MAYIKTKIGEHDYHKPACSAYCKIGGEFCPFVGSDRKKTEGIFRWTDLADAKNNEARGKTVNKNGYTADYSGKSVDTKPDGQSADKPVESNKYAEFMVAGYSCWGDGSGFEYDLMPRNTMGKGGPAERIYDIGSYGIQHDVLRFSRWNAWIDKFQYDYRFGQVSDTNAECILFPNVDNPWMFTEYIFKGIGGSSGKCALSIPDEYVVEPPVYNPENLTLINGDHYVSKKDTDFDGKYAFEDSESSSSDESSSSAHVKAFREIVNWGELVSWSFKEANSSSSLMETLNKDAENIVVADSGVKLYRARIPVQCIKWGEHGNIPPHTLDMTAPDEWFNPNATVVKMKAVYDAVVGTTINAEYDGVISWNGSQVIITTGMTFDESEAMENASSSSSSGELDADDFYYTYTGGSQVEMSMPREQTNGEYVIMKPATKIMPSPNYGEYCHGGCGNLIGIDGCMYCKLIMNGDLSHKDYFDIENCLNKGSYGDSDNPCDKYVGTPEHPKIASYQDKRIGVDQMSLNAKSSVAGGMMMGIVGGVGGALIGGEMAQAGIANDIDKIADYYSNLGKRSDIDVSYTVRYEPVMGTGESAKLNKKKYNEFGKGVQIVPGTGKYAIDSKENANPFSGGDTVSYDDINTLSFHRFFTSVMHCSSQKYCNSIMGLNQKDGFDVKERAGGEGKCRYYRDESEGGCPYNGAPKRAIEFANCSALISSYVNIYLNLYNSYASKFIFSLDPGVFDATTKNLYKKVTKGDWNWRVFSNFAIAIRPGSDESESDNSDGNGNDEENDDSGSDEEKHAILVVAVPRENASSLTTNVDYCSDLGGAALILDKTNVPDGHLIFCEFSAIVTETEFTPSNNDGGNESGGNESVACKRYVALEGFYWFKPLYNNGSALKKNDTDEKVPKNLRQHVDKNGYWFCKMRFDHIVPTTNCMLIDNEDKFIGGWHPEYKDYSKRGGEFMQDIVSDASREGQGMGDYVQNGDYTPIPQSTNKKGYWVDQSGEYILDERDIGVDVPIMDADSRVETGSGSVTCLSYKKSNTEMDMTTGKKKQPKVEDSALFSNDPYDFIFNVLKKEGKPKFEDPDTGREYPAPPYVGNRYLLPTLRHAVHCPKCDYYLSYKYHDIETCPWCGSTLKAITGDAGTGMKEGDVWSSDASIIKKFFKIYAMGNVDVWAPPGTCVKTSAYFWKRQAQITNGLRKQILHRLGSPNSSPTAISQDEKTNMETGGAYKFDKMSPASEMTLGYPEGLGAFLEVPYGAESDTALSYKRYHNSKIKWNTEQNACDYGMYNPIMPRHMIPGWYGDVDTGSEDEGVIAPYSTKAEDSLKLVSQEQMRVFRNGIEPIYAYCSGDTYSGDYPVFRASYDQRESQDQPIIWNGRRSVIAPQVLACVNDEGGPRDSFQTYFSGDLVYGNVREYFPSGYTWWMMKNVIGGRITQNLGGWYHMDDGGKVGRGVMVGGSGGEYTCGTRTVAKCAISIYGLLPLDKEILKAYVIISPSGVEPSKDPIGRSWTGGPVMYCHYHAKTTTHYGDGTQQHLHGTAGYPEGQYFDENGEHVDTNPPGTIVTSADDIRYQDESAYAFWGEGNMSVADDRGLYYEDRTLEIMTNLPCLYDSEFHRKVGTAKVAVSSYDGESVIGMGYDADSFGTKAGFIMKNLSNTEVKRKQKYQYIAVDGDGFVVEKYPESEVWKTTTTQEIEESIASHTSTIEFHVSDGTIENSKSYIFKQTDSELYMDEIPRESQEITGYFDMSWANTKGYAYGEYAVEQPTGGGTWNAPVIFQDASTVAQGQAGISKPSNDYSGGGDWGQVGQVPRCFDVTTIVKPMYENRIKREFYAHAGCSLENLKKWTYYKPISKGGKLDADVEKQNDCTYESGSSGIYILTDGNSYPELDGNIDYVPSIDEDGDKYELKKKEILIVLEFSLPLVITGENCNYCISVSDEEPSEEDRETSSISIGTYTSSSDLLGAVKGMFSGADEVKTEGNTKISVRSTKNIYVFDVGDNCYGKLGISTGTFNVSQSRVVEVTNYATGYHPDNLFSDVNKPWTFIDYSRRRESFTVDLLRAPLCQWQRDWRYEEGTSDYSNARCPEDGCKAHSMGVAVAANKSNKYFNSSSPNCPLCGASLDTDDNKGRIVSSPGDGIKTYHYDAPFSPDPIISKIKVTPHASYMTSYRVMSRADSHDTWRTLIDVGISLTSENNEITKEYMMNYPERKSLGKSGVADVTISGIVRGRFLKVECDEGSQISEKHVYTVKRAATGDGYQVQATGDFSNWTNFEFSGIHAVVSSQYPSNYTETSIENSSDKVEIVSAYILSDRKDAIRFSLSKKVYGDNENGTKYIVFYVHQFTGGIKELKVYGLHYKEESSGDADNDPGSGGKYLTIMPMEDEHTWMLSLNSNKYKMPEAPIQIYEVSVGRNGGSGVRLSEATDSSTALKWTTEKKSLTIKEKNSKGVMEEKTINYKVITGGNYYYNPISGEITVPTTDNENEFWGKYEDSLRERGYADVCTPNTLTIRYCNGNGKSVTLSAMAAGHGPSYMLEKNAIQYFTSETLDALPSNGKMCKTLKMDGTDVNSGTVDMKWMCYNNKPAVLSIEKQSTSNSKQGSVQWTAGEFRKPSFTGKEIAGKMDDDKAFVDLFGQYAENCYGQCETEMTITGAPNKILSGELRFYAKGVTETSMDLGNGTTLKYSENTGGIKQGFLIVSCAPISTETGRDTVCYSVPELLIYAKEAKTITTENTKKT